MRPVGDRGQLIELGSNAAAHAFARSARSSYGDELVEVVPGHRTVLLVWRDRPQVVKVTPDPADDATGDTQAIPVLYDGADLDTVAAQLGVSTEAVVELHSEAVYTVAFMGFSPGFPYLIAEAPSALLELPRLETPRTEVPAGSVAVAAGYCGIYPRASPGGWNLLGRTDVVLFDAGRERPALLEPGMRVRFRPDCGSSRPESPR